MKITKIETLLVNLSHGFLVNPQGNRNWPLVKIHTDEGIYGVGECYSAGPDRATVEVVRDFEQWLIGRDPRDVEALWSLMYTGSRFPGGSIINSAISGIEHALWDIAGKAAGLPVYMLVGGKCRNKIRVYQSCSGATPEAIGEDASRLVETYGYTALKMSPLPPGYQEKPWGAVIRETEARVASVRDAIGDDVEIGLDIHARVFEISKAVEICNVVEQFRPYFVEEPLRPENYDALEKLSNHTDVPLATGEMLYTRHEFRELLKRDIVNIIQPDICLTGGLWETKKIASMAEAHYVSVAPHNPCGPIATAVNTHFAASTQNFEILEYKADEGVRAQLVCDEPMKLVDGYLELPDKPGLGIDINEELARSLPDKPWHRPFPWKVDGSLAFQ